MYKTPAPSPTRHLDPSSRSATPFGAAGCPRVCWRQGCQTNGVHQVELPKGGNRGDFFCSESGAPFSHPMDIYFKRHPWIFILKVLIKDCANYTYTSWWLNQPIWKMIYSQFENLPQMFGVNMKKKLSCHHPVMVQKSGKLHQLRVVGSWNPILLLGRGSLWNLQKTANLLGCFPSKPNLRKYDCS